MNGLQIKRESLPVRCEICHQADMFDAETGACGRCRDVSASMPVDGKPRLTGVERFLELVGYAVILLVGLMVLAVGVCGVALVFN